MNKKIVIVGGVAGGATAAARLRRLDENCTIVLLERGPHISFANCGLPYYIGGEITDKAALTLQTPASFRARFRVDVRVENEVTAIDRDAKTVAVRNVATGESYTESYDTLVLSMGAEPVKPPIPGVKSDKVFSLRNIPDTYRIKEFLEEHTPKTAVVMGGGYIGVEMAENLCAAGLTVTVIEMQEQVIAPLDYDMACDVHHHMESRGVQLLLGCKVEAIVENDSGLVVSTSGGDIPSDMLIMAVGVRPESGLAKDAGLAVNARGSIVVDNHMRTQDPAVYAVGDAVEVTDFVTGEAAMIPLAGPANKQGRIAADNIAGCDSVYGGTQGSSILKVFDMTVATTGINEKTAKRLGIPYDKAFTYSASHAGYYPGATNIAVKTLFDPESGRILGAQLTGFAGVDKRCDVLATAIRFGATAHDLTTLELCYAPPYSSAKDPVNMAGYVIENLLTGKVKQFHWHDMADILQNEDVVLLDTRTEWEFGNGHIPGAVNIPLDSLRDRLGELDPTLPHYVYCQVALRGYLACRILSQNGIDVWNLGGGYRLYRSIFGDAVPPDPIGTGPVNCTGQPRN